MLQPVNNSPDLTVLERLVLETALSSARIDTGFLGQIDAATVVARTPSGVGFMTKLDIPETCRVADTEAGSAVPVVTGTHPALLSGAEFVLQIKDGRINCIEAYCHEGMWPADESLFQIRAGP